MDIRNLPQKDPLNNQLLGALPAADRQRWRPHLEAVHMPLGKVLWESGRKTSHVYFPTTAILSLQYVLEDGASSEMAVVGNEGAVGIPLLMRGVSAPSRAVVERAGLGFRVSAQMLREELNRSLPLMHLLLCYTQAQTAETAQTAACNRHHSLDQQLCRRLLMSLDRQVDSELALTQEVLGSLLGVRREAVTRTALRLQRAGLIRYARGHLTVLNRAGLEKRTCECYAAVKKEYDRLLPPERLAA